ncbi:MAG: hypothetical protein J6K17_14650 [Oscillospiraceae bacterium]|nr:hypothetical protein [Oscillospiraceae bacterium]
MDECTTKEYINSPWVDETHKITNSKEKIVLESCDGKTHLYINGVEIKMVTSVCFTHDVDDEDTPVLVYSKHIPKETKTEN